MPKFTRDDINVITYGQANASTLRQFQELVLSLTPDQDDENGPDTWDWVLANNAIFPVGGPYVTFIYSLKSTGEIVATGTFTSDDRNALKDNGITAFGVVGFVNVVRRDLRGLGLGTLVLQHLDQHIQRVANESGADQSVYLFTSDPGIYRDYGFDETGRSIEFLGKQEPLCIKVYTCD